MSLPIRMNAGELWEFRGQRLIFERELGDNFIYFIREQNGGPFQIESSEGALGWPSTEWFLDGLRTGELKKVLLRDSFVGPQKRAQLDDDHAALNALDPKARLRAFVTRGLDAMGDAPRSDRALTLALARLWAEQPDKAAAFGGKPSTRSVRRWLNGRGLPGERLLREMVALNGRAERAKRLPAVTHALLKRYVAWYWTRTGWSVVDAFARFTKRLNYINTRRRRTGDLPQLHHPSYETFRKQVRKQETYETYQLKHGAKKARLRFKACGTGLSASRFLRLGCMDHTTLDGIVVIDTNLMLPVGRPTLTVLMDVRTRCIVGHLLSFEPASLYSVMECIKRGNRPKLLTGALAKRYPVLNRIFGRFDEIVVDNGKEFSGTSLEDAMADVGTAVRFAPIRSPTYKAVVERVFGTLNSLHNTKLPGAVFKTELLREMGYDPSKDAVLTLEDLEDLLQEAIAVYHVSHHTGIDAIPAELWQQDMDAYGINVIGDEKLLDKALGAITSCRVTTSGVALFGLRYHDENKVGALLEDLISFEPVRGQRKGSAVVTVKVKYNPANLAEIHVWNRHRKTYVTLPCEDERYAAGMSLWHHRKLQEWAKNRGAPFNTLIERLVARADLIERIENSAPHLKGKTRNAMRRILNGPKVQKPSGSPVIAYAPARHDGLAPIIEHDLLARSRADGGQEPKRPARPKKPNSDPRKRRRKSSKSLPPPNASGGADFSVDITKWQEPEL